MAGPPVVGELSSASGRRGALEGATLSLRRGPVKRRPVRRPRRRSSILALVSEPVLVPPGGGEIVGDSPERRVEIISDHETLHATWSRFGPHRDGADLHIHRAHTDLF